jgi:hypothetical protein
MYCLLPVLYLTILYLKKRLCGEYSYKKYKFHKFSVSF